MQQTKQTQQQVRIDEQLHRDAKAAAAQQGRTLYEWLNEAIREKLNRSQHHQVIDAA